MSSINDTHADTHADTGADDLLAALFDDIVLPLSQRMRASGVQAFPEAPDVQWLSYYVRRKHVANVPADFHDGSCADADEFALRLASQWRALGRTELAGHVGRFAEVAAVLRAELSLTEGEAGAGSADVSPYVYVMF